MSSIVSNLQGFFYWLIISKVAGPSILGLTTAVVGLGSLIAGFLSLGMAIGIQKHLGKCFGLNDFDGALKYYWSTFTFTVMIYTLVGASLYFAGYSGFSFSRFTPEMIRMAGFLIAVSWIAFFQALFISMFRTKIVFTASSAAAALKFVVGVLLVIRGFGWVGAVAGYLVAPLAALIMYLLYTRRYFKFKFYFSTKHLRDVLAAGIVSWFPGVIVLVGQWLGVLVVFGAKGGAETGYYFIAFMIAQLVLMISNSMMKLLLPLLSGMVDGRKRAGSRVLRISLAVMTPIAIYLIAYPQIPLELLGKNYATASNTMRILLLSNIPLVMTALVNSLCYAYDKYLEVLYVGLSQNIPRVILYVALVPKYSGLGAALSYFIGSLTGVSKAIHAGLKVGYKFNYWEIAKIMLIPTLIIIIPKVAGLNWFESIILLLVSYVLYIKFKIVTRRDLKEVALSFLSREKVLKLYEKLRPILEPLLE